MAWQALGGALNTAVKAVSWTLDGSRIDIFSRDYNYFIVHKVYNGNWGAWESLGPGVIQSEPTIVRRSPATKFRAVIATRTISSASEKHSRILEAAASASM